MIATSNGQVILTYQTGKIFPLISYHTIMNIASYVPYKMKIWREINLANQRLIQDWQI